MATSLSTPVVLILFRRPQETARVIEAMAQARPERLFVIADGPRPGTPGEAEACAAARKQIEQIRWPCELFTNMADSNLGVKKRVESGLTWVFSQVEEAIILEDDCLPNASFFPYCEELLRRYRSDHRIMTISGSSFPDRLPYAESYRFSRYPLIWGWATWRRAWAHYDPEMRDWNDVTGREWLAGEFPNHPAAQRYWSYCFQQTAARQHTWDYAWTHACWRHGGLSVLPQQNLVTNIGFGPAASHTFDASSRFAGIPAQELSFPLRHPAVIAPDRERDLRLEALAYSGEEFLKPMFRAIRTQINSRSDR